MCCMVDGSDIATSLEQPLKAQESIEVAGKTVNEVLVEKIATIGENLNISV